MRSLKAGLVVLLALGISACAVKPINPIGMDANFYQDNSSTVGVYIAAPGKVDTHLTGASCLLCYAAAAAANSSLTKHIQTLNVSELTEIKAEIVSIMQGKGKQVQLIEKDLQLNKLEKFKPKTEGFAEVNFTKLKKTLAVDKLLIVQIDMLGAQRSYNGYVPTSSPVGVVSGKMFMVDLATNKLELYQLVHEYVSVAGEWDEPTTFPGVTNAYFQAVEQAKMHIKRQL